MVSLVGWPKLVKSRLWRVFSWMYGVTVYEIVDTAATVSNPDFYTEIGSEQVPKSTIAALGKMPGSEGNHGQTARHRQYCVNVARFYTGCTTHVQRPQILWGHRSWFRVWKSDPFGTHCTLATCAQLVPQKPPESALSLPFCLKLGRWTAEVVSLLLVLSI